jgi:hypothetical protein
MGAMHYTPEYRGSAPKAPAPTRAEVKAGEVHAAYVAGRELVERRRQVRGLVLLALGAIAFGVWRAGLARAFTPGWWRVW